MAVINADANATSNSLAFSALIDTLNNGFATGCVQPERHHHSIEKDNQATPILLLMPAWSLPTEKTQYLGVKIVNIFPDNRLKNLPGLTSTYILYNVKQAKNWQYWTEIQSLRGERLQRPHWQHDICRG